MQYWFSTRPHTTRAVDGKSLKIRPSTIIVNMVRRCRYQIKMRGSQRPWRTLPFVSPARVKIAVGTGQVWNIEGLLFV